MNPSPQIEEKAVRMLADARVTVGCDESGLVARVLGDHDEHVVQLTRRGPFCPCPSWRRQCSHALAVAKITGGQP